MCCMFTYAHVWTHIPVWCHRVLCEVTASFMMSEYPVWWLSDFYEFKESSVMSQCPVWSHRFFYDVRDTCVMSQSPVWHYRVLCGVIESCVSHRKSCVKSQCPVWCKSLLWHQSFLCMHPRLYPVWGELTDQDQGGLGFYWPFLCSPSSYCNTLSYNALGLFTGLTVGPNPEGQRLIWLGTSLFQVSLIRQPW